MKDIKDYLHLYLGQQCLIKLVFEEGYSSPVTLSIDCLRAALFDEGNQDHIDVMLLLRPLLSMTDEERVQRGREVTRYGRAFIEAEYHRWMLSNGFDLFGLIEAGLAIDATTLKEDK